MKREVNYAKFNGDGYIHLPIKTNSEFSNELHELTNSNFTFYIKTKPDTVVGTEDRFLYKDTTLMCRSGLHTGLHYTTMNNFKANVWDTFRNEYTIHSPHYDGQLVNLIMTFDSKSNKHSLYLNGNKVFNDNTFESDSHIPENASIHEYSTEYSDYYVGAANPFVDNFECFYSGKIYEVAMWNTILPSQEIKNFKTNEFDMDLSIDYNNYNSSENLVTYWNFDIIQEGKVFDESGNEHWGLLHNVDIETEIRTW